MVHRLSNFQAIDSESLPAKKPSSAPSLLSKLEAYGSCLSMLLSTQTDFAVSIPIERFLKLIVAIFLVDGSMLVRALSRLTLTDRLL